MDLVYLSSMRALARTSVLFLVACGGDDGGSNDAAQPDAPVNVPAMITVSGTATERQLDGSSAPAEGVAVGAFKSTDESTPVVTTTSDAQGNYSLVIPTGGAPVDGYIKGTKAGDRDTYLYAPSPLVADFNGASINLLSDFIYSTGLVALCQAGTLDPAKGIIAVIVQDAAGTPVAGATVAAEPAATKTCYTDGTSPTGSKTETAADGVALMFNVADNETVSAMKAGVTFKSHVVKVFAGALTTTLIVQ